MILSGIIMVIGLEMAACFQTATGVLSHGAIVPKLEACVFQDMTTGKHADAYIINQVCLYSGSEAAFINLVKAHLQTGWNMHTRHCLGLVSDLAFESTTHLAHSFALNTKPNHPSSATQPSP